jgi:hypothetical protein
MKSPITAKGCPKEETELSAKRRVPMKYIHNAR